MQITLIQQDAAGNQTTNEVVVGLLPFLKSLATAGDIDRTRFQTFRKMSAALAFYWEHFQFGPYFNVFALRPLHHNDPTELGQFSNRVGKALADYFARRLSGAIQTHTYEDALAVRHLPIVGQRPDLYCDTGFQQFSMEAKGFSVSSVSDNAMKNHKAQAQSGLLPVNFAVACISYNLFGHPLCKYYDPPIADAPYNDRLNRMLARLKYARLLSVLDMFPRVGISTVANQRVERFRITDDEDVPLTLLVAERIRTFVRRSGPIFRGERFEEVGLFLDNDGVGLEVG
jgi:hypothetical protein